jgi:hypothetical protein
MICYDGRTVLPAMSYCTACHVVLHRLPCRILYRLPWQELLSCEPLSIPTAAATGTYMYYQMYTEHRHHRNHARKAEVGSPSTAPWFYLQNITVSLLFFYPPPFFLRLTV